MAEPTTTTFSRVNNDEFYSNFHYPPLDPSQHEIRLLRVDSYGKDSHELISNVSLDNPPAFVALSYVCGSPANTKQMQVNGRVFSAFANLVDSIRELREGWAKNWSGKSLLIWTDQICINQSDNDERASQVANMRNVYSGAEATLIRLPASIDIVHPFEEWVSCKEWLQQQCEHLRATLAYARGDKDPATCKPPTAILVRDIVLAVHEVYSWGKSDWWSRAWVYQEFLVSKSAFFIVSPFFVPWQDFFQILRIYYESWDTFSSWRGYMGHLLSENEGLIRNHMKVKGLVPYCDPSCDFCHILYDMYIGDSVGVWAYYNSLETQYNDILTAFAGHYLGFISVFDDKAASNSNLSLSTVMKRSRHRKTSEPRDKVYAYLGLLKRAEVIVPDYQSKLNALRTHVARCIIEEDARLDILLQTREDGRESTLDDPLPSWVPSWTVLEEHRTTDARRKYFSLARYDGLKVFQELRNADAACEFHDNTVGGGSRTMLKARGLKVDCLLIRHDDEEQNIYSGSLQGLTMRVGARALTGDEVWAIQGANDFVVLRRVAVGHEVISEAILVGDYLTKDVEVLRSISAATFDVTDVFIV